MIFVKKNNEKSASITSKTKVDERAALYSAIGYFVGDWVVNLHEGKESPVQISSIYPFSIKISLF
ncbi:MAG: hypothetical protein WC879_16470 [Melioribacteraceae bacterium]